MLVNLAVTVYLVEKGTKFWKERRRLKRLVNQHPEMNGVHPDEDGLFVFESDDSLKMLVLENDQPGSDEPFYVTEEELEED